MDRIGRILKEIVAPAAILTLAILASTLSGCTVATHQITITDPSHLRVLIKNESSYVLELEGVIQGKLAPEGVTEFHVNCRGVFEGVAHAYKIIGETNFGEKKLFPMGQQKFQFRTDGINYEYHHKSYDAVVILSSFSRGRTETHYLLYNGPCGIFSD